MITRHMRGKTVWVDLESPTEEELALVMREFDIDERIHEEIATPTPYPLTIPFGGYTYLILHFPVAGSEDGTRSQEVDFIVGKQFLITARYEPVESLHNLHRILEAEELLNIPEHTVKTGAFLERVISRLYASISTEIEQVGKRLERIERDIFSGREQHAVRTISEAGRVLLRFETALARHKEPLADFLAALATPQFFGSSFEEHTAHIEARRIHAASLVSSLRAVAQELRITNDSLLTASQNQVTKTLTVMAFVALPLTLIASIFGMNAENMPIVHLEHGFWLVLGLMVFAGLSLFTYFRLKKWL
ncbi:MAG TPA: CorA family divalent cation transporter [Candidatus Paceibacterota bacterium]